MASGLMTTPRENGVPYIIWPSGELPPAGLRTPDRIADWHHSEHPKGIVLAAGIGGEAVRGARKQWVLYNDHHDETEGYHDFYGGPAPLTTTQEEATTVIMESSLYIPSVALDFSGKNPREVKVTDEARKWLIDSGQIQIASLPAVRRFLISHALEQGFERISEGTIDKFLHAATQERRVELAHYILSQLIEAAVDPIRQPYCQARKQGHILPNYPARPEHYVKRRIVRTPKHLNVLINRLQYHAAQHYRLTYLPQQLFALDQQG